MCLTVRHEVGSSSESRVSLVHTQGLSRSLFLSRGIAHTFPLRFIITIFYFEILLQKMNMNEPAECIFSSEIENLEIPAK